MAANRHDNDRMIGLAPSQAAAAKPEIKEAVIELSLSAIMLSDLEGHITGINPAFLRLWGYDSRVEILGSRLSDLVLDRDEADALIKKSILHGSCRGELIIVRKSGTLRVAQCEFRTLSGLNGDAPCLAASFLDITERAEAQHSLRTSEARYRNIVNAVPVGIAMTDAQGAITFYSAQAREMFALVDDQAALGTHCSDWIAPGQLEELAPLFRTGPVPNPLELRLLRADGSEFWAEAAVVTLDEEALGHEEAQGGHLIVVRNISGRKRAEEALSNYARDLERSNQELEQFAYVASHDLQEPLRMVAAYVQLLAKDYQGHFSAEADEYITFAVEGAKRMQRLIDDLLTYSRVGTRGQAFQPVDCSEVVSEVLSNLRLAIDESGAAVTWDALPVVRGDRGQVFQLLQNLIGNALKFRAAAAPVIHIRACLQPRSSQRSCPKQAIWQFSVRDNGIGIDSQYRERIFVIFQRLHSRSHYSGTGIGLAICKKIVERHGGRIWVESAPGQGATFYFTLPGDPASTPSL